MTKVQYKNYMSRASAKYYEDSISAYGIEFNENEYEIPNDDQDKMANMDSQLSGIIDIKKHTKYFIQNVAEMAAEILGDVRAKDVMNEIKRRKD